MRFAESPAPWAALLADGDAERALDAAVAIARDLTDPPESESKSPAIAGGLAGEAIFYAYLEQCHANGGFGERGFAKLEQALDLVAAEATTPGLYQGFTGVAWTVDHLQSRLFASAADEDSNAEVDEALLRLLRSSPWPGHFDLMSGLAGHAVYALSRLPRPAAVESLELLADHLAELAVEQPSGRAWFTPRERLVEEAREFFTGGNYNLGASHGAAGVIAALGRICRAGIATAKARPLLDDAVGWLLSRKLEGCKALFPTAVGPGVEVKFSRLAWCYGDAGIAATLLVAARAAGEASWEREALAIARHSARRPFETTLIRDGCLCHGAAGLAHLYNRMYQATGDEPLRQAALHWYRWLLDYRRPGQGIGGFLNWFPTIDLQTTWRADRSFLNGAAGIGLALLAAATPVEPRWDELMLLSPTAPAADAEGPDPTRPRTPT